MTMTTPNDSPPLTAQHCENYGPGTPTLPQDQVERLLSQVPGWTLSEDGTGLHWTKRFADFAEALAFVNKVGEIAEAEDHHPDFRIHGYRNIDLDLSTHSIGGLSRNDFIMAAKINEVVP
jgi:4a-hydroxytetrahydrobiopterin dehydratase